MDESQLIEKAKNGDKIAFGHLYQKYFQKIYRYCKINLYDDELAKDICQESFVRAYKKLKDFKIDGQWSIQAFLFAIARNLIIDFTRKKKNFNIDNFENLESSENLYDEFEKSQNIKKVKNILSKLKEEEKQIVILRYFEELPSQEVAKILKINDGALRVRTFRLMQKMKDLYESLYGRNN